MGASTVFTVTPSTSSEPDSSVSLVSDYSLDDWGSIPDKRQRIFPLVSAFRPALGPKQPPVQWVLGALPGAQASLGCVADHSPPSSAKVNKK
jgi:hypothetical protein